jgi:hypothetical protein
VYLSDFAPAVFTQTPKGIGQAVAQHISHPKVSVKKNSTVNHLNPAYPGETIVLFLTGLNKNPPKILFDDEFGKVEVLHSQQSTNNGQEELIITLGEPQFTGLHHLKICDQSGLNCSNEVDIFTTK